MSKQINIGGRIHSTEVGNVLTGANEVLDDNKGKKQNVINAEVDAELLRLDQSKQNNLMFDNTPTENSINPVKSSGVYAADKALSDAIEAILILIPSAATELNQLADKLFVNSSIATATATFRGTYNLVSDLNLSVDAKHAQIEDALNDLNLEADNNDYAFVQVPVSGDEVTEIERTERYKFNGEGWVYEYTLNTSGFTAAQWSAINSGITTALVEKLDGLPTNEALQQALSAITQGLLHINELIPSEATAQNHLADKAYVLDMLLSAIPAFKGQFTNLAQLQNVADPKYGDIGIVRTKDSAGYDVFTFYQYKNNQWNEYYVMSYHPQDKPATTGWLGDYSYNGMGRIELPMNMVDGWPDNTWIYLQKNDVVYLLYSWHLQLYAVYNIDTQEGLGLDDNLVVKPENYDIADLEEIVDGHYLLFTEEGGVWTITKPDGSTITSTELNNMNIYHFNDPTHHGINVLTQEMFNRINTIYVIQYDFTLGEDITIPENCILEFDGGSLGNGTIIGNHTYIDSKTLCIKKDITIGGTWDNDIIYTRWFEFLSIDDGKTDNLLAFKQVQSMANGVGNVKIEFEPNMYLQSSIPQLVHSNAHRYNGTESILYFDKVDYVEINLNGSTIKLLDNDSVWTNIICVSRTNAVIKNGHLTGNADVDNYPPYVNTDGTVGYTYEWGYGLCLLGGNLTAENLDISYCKGDGINAGSWWVYPEGDLSTSIVGNYNILNCNVSYTGRNGMAFKSSDYGTVRHCNIHHIGSNGTVQGRLPKAGIDLEFEDLPHAEGYTPSLDFSNLHISDCDNNTIVTARIVKNDVTLGTPVKSFSLRDSYLKGTLQLAQINVGNYYVNDGNVKINNNVIEANANDTTHSLLAVHTYKNCRFIINSFVFPANGRFEDCEFLQPSGGSSIFATEQSIVTAPEFLNCDFIISYLNLTDATITNSNLYFKAATSNTSRRSIYNGTTITGHVDGTKKTRIIFDDNNVEKTIAQLRHCSLKNLGNLDGSTDGVLFYTSATFDDCVFEECEFSISDYNVIINCCSGKNMFLRTPSAEGTGKFIFSSSVCKALTTSSLLRGDGRITLNDSVIELSAGDLTKQYFNLHNSMLTAVDKTKRTIEAFSPTIKALNSILNIGEYVYWSLNMNKSMYKNIQGLWIDDNGGDVGVSLSGTTTSRPEGNQIYIGFSYFDTTLGKPIYAKEITGASPYTVTWVDATGASV